MANVTDSQYTLENSSLQPIATQLANDIRFAMFVSNLLLKKSRDRMDGKSFHDLKLNIWRGLKDCKKILSSLFPSCKESSQLGGQSCESDGDKSTVFDVDLLRRQLELNIDLARDIGIECSAIQDEYAIHQAIHKIIYKHERALTAVRKLKNYTKFVL